MSSFKWILKNFHLYSCYAACMFTVSLQSRPTLCNPMDFRLLPGSSVHGILQAKNAGVGCRALRQGRTCVSYVYLHWQVCSLPLASPRKPSVMLTLGFNSVGEFQKAKKHALPNTNVGINDCLLEESSPKLPRKSPGDQCKDLLRYVFGIGKKVKLYFEKILTGYGSVYI